MVLGIKCSGYFLGGKGDVVIGRIYKNIASRT